MKTLQTRLSTLTKDRFLRNDEKYQEMVLADANNLFSTSTRDNVPLSDVLQEDYMDFLYEDGIIYKGIPTGQSCIDEDGEIVDYQIAMVDNHPGRLKYAINSDSILISSLRNAKSPALLFEDLDLSEYVFSNGFYIFKVKPGWNTKFALYLLRSKRIKRLIDNNLYRGIGISAYRVDDLLSCEVKKLSLTMQENALSKIYPLEREIKEQKAKLHDPKTIIDEVLSSEFRIDLSALYAIDEKKIIKASSSSVSSNNTNLRFSYRWNKAMAIQSEIIAEVDCSEKLGNYILNTQNGWSPDCDETQTALRVLGIDAIRKDGTICFENVKYSDAQRSNLESVTISDGDFFVSRGNTTELVAMAAIASVREEDPITIFPDLMIRITFDERIDKQYLAYVFNSFIGRLYFKYATKGKNQTMVKVSPGELYDFVVPLPDIAEQKRIASKIAEQLEKQALMRSKIAKLRERIDRIIENTMTNSEGIV